MLKYVIHIGTWTNWSRGRIMGATLTLSRTDGNYLLTFTSLFIALISACFWSTVRLVMHRCHSTPALCDALHHQQQVVLRNSSSAFGSVLSLCSLGWAWRQTADGKRYMLRLVPGILTAAFVAVAFSIASGFSSQISSGIGNQVLLDGTNCSLVDWQQTSGGYNYAVTSFYSRMIADVANYAQQCYSNATSGMFDCNSLVKPRLPSTVDTQAPCPFAKGLCQSENENIRMDTGYLNSNDHLGMNAPPDERMLFRSVLTCAPLATEGFAMNVSGTTGTGNYTTYYYGDKFSGENYTYKARSLQSQYSNDDVDIVIGAAFLLA